MNASAQSEAERRERARQLAAEGFDALQRKDYAVAEDRFRRADAAVHAPTLVVDHARALIGLGRLVEAHERYELVLREGVAANAPWQWRQAYTDAERELEALKPRLAWLKLRVLGAREPTVLIDNRPVPLAALGVRRATDPGTHSVSVSAPGFLPREEMVTLDEGASIALDIELEPDPTLKASLPHATAAPQAPAPAAPLPSPARDDTLAYVVLGIGGLGIAGGLVTGGLALGARSDLKALCSDGVCRPTSQQELREHQTALDNYHLWGTISGVSFAVGLAAAATGSTLLLLGGPSDAPQAGSVPTVRAYVGIGSLGLSGRF